MDSDGRATFLYTNSYDATVDLLVSRLGSDAVFRFNLDLWRDYAIEIRPNGFSLEDPTGRRLTSENVAKACWRKPQFLREPFPRASGNGGTSEEAYLEDELSYAMDELVNLLWREQKLVLVEPVLTSALASSSRCAWPPACWTFRRGNLCEADAAFRLSSVRSSKVSAVRRSKITLCCLPAGSTKRSLIRRRRGSSRNTSRQWPT